MALLSSPDSETRAQNPVDIRTVVVHCAIAKGHLFAPAGKQRSTFTEVDKCSKETASAVKDIWKAGHGLQENTVLMVGDLAGASLNTEKSGDEQYMRVPANALDWGSCSATMRLPVPSSDGGASWNISLSWRKTLGPVQRPPA